MNLVGKERPHGVQINTFLKRKMLDLEEWSYEQLKKGKNIDFDSITINHGGSQLTFYGFATNHIEKRKISPATYKLYYITINKFQEFAPNIPLMAVDRIVIDDFENHLIKKGLHVNTVHRYLKEMRYFMNIAEQQEYFNESKNPFKKKKLHKIKTEPRYIDPEIIDRLVIMEFIEPHLEVIRDLFIFSVYTGLRYSDLMNLTKAEVFKNKQGYFIQKQMIKTSYIKKSKLYIPLWNVFNGAAQVLIEKYISDDRDTIFPVLTNQHINRSLKLIWNKMGLTQSYTFHSARHTCATYLLYKGVNIKIVQKILGHENLKTTEGYAQVLRKTIDRELDNIRWD